MAKAFHTVALIGKPNSAATTEALTKLHHWLQQHGMRVLVDARIAEPLKLSNNSYSLDELGAQADLALVVGGDGNMLSAARALCQYSIAMIGINRGNLGFLADLPPDDYEGPLLQVLSGAYQEEERFLLETSIWRNGLEIDRQLALNEVVLHPSTVAKMIEFELYCNHSFMCSQRSDGLIIATPTGSTAYSLSAGGSILSPTLQAITLVPMFPHTLSARPIVLDANSEIRLFISPENRTPLIQVSCDGQELTDVKPNDEVIVRKSHHPLKLVHPLSYDYFTVLRNKLGWGSKLF